MGVMPASSSTMVWLCSLRRREGRLPHAAFRAVSCAVSFGGRGFKSRRPDYGPRLGGGLVVGALAEFQLCANVQGCSTHHLSSPTDAGGPCESTQRVCFLDRSSVPNNGAGELWWRRGTNAATCRSGGEAGLHGAACERRRSYPDQPDCARQRPRYAGQRTAHLD